MKKLLCAMICLAGMAAADKKVQATWSGELVSVRGRQIYVKDINGQIWLGELTPDFQVDWQGRKVPLSTLSGQKMMFRLVGESNITPRRVDLIADLASSPKYVAKGAPVPSHTRKGTMAGPGGVGGEPDNGPVLGKQPNAGGHAVNGGFPHQNQNNKVP